MKKYTFIKKNTFGENEAVPFLAITNEIEELKLAETYNDYGQPIGHTDAGDYCIHNNDYFCAFVDMKIAVVEHFKIDEDLEFDITCDTLEATEDINVDVEELKAFCEKWREENETFNSVKGFDYWDGSNWKTVVVECEFGEPSHFVVEENVDAMNEAIENMTFVQKSNGKEIYESEEFWIVESFWATSYDRYALFPKSEFELEELI